MKRTILLISPIYLLLTSLFTGCIEDTCERNATFVRFEPVYMSYGEFRESFEVDAPRELNDPGKMYFKDGYIFISERNEGIHVVDNRDPENPQLVAFMQIIGNHDIAAKGDILYADSHIDMLVIDISSPAQPELVDRRENIFPYEMAFFDGNALWADANRGVVRSWESEVITEELACNELGDENAWPMPVDCINCFLNDRVGFGAPEVNFGAETPTGVGGSMARFTIARDHLYAVTNQQLITFDIGDLRNPNKVSEPYIGWDIETIFPYGDHLFIGSRTGMYIYNIEVPAQPLYVSEFRHARSCDPVVVDGDYAYVTLRSGNPVCDGFTNELNVVNISRLDQPYLEKAYPMQNPHGLGIRDTTLFICDGEAGLKVFNTADIYKIDENQRAHFKDIHAFDVIPLHQVLLLIGEDGFYQYDYANTNDIRLMSQIPVTRN